ncbi:hypothetical protein SAMN05444416_10278 [Thermoactinomyces sp. DSM 45892]|nr:hypothetical protein SAMN05444416_10278 [Thermoactinomyces sp. DSM 45892]
MLFNLFCIVMIVALMIFVWKNVKKNQKLIIFILAFTVVPFVVSLITNKDHFVIGGYIFTALGYASISIYTVLIRKRVID